MKNMSKLFSLGFLLIGVTIATAQSPQPISAKEAQAFGEEIEREFDESGSDFFMKAIDLQRLMDITLTNQPGKDDLKA